MQALPFTYPEVRAGDGAAITVTVHGEAGGDWFLVRKFGRWQQVLDGPSQPTARVFLGQDSARELFTKRMDRQTALARFPDKERQVETTVDAIDGPARGVDDDFHFAVPR